MDMTSLMVRMSVRFIKSPIPCIPFYSTIFSVENQDVFAYLRKIKTFFYKNIFAKPIAKYGSLWYNISVVKSNADVAQLVEQLIRNQQVAGSSPAISSIRKAKV